MAQGEYKINVPIEVTYQAPNSATGKTVNMEVFDETKTIVVGGPTVLSEIAATGRYYGSFTPDAEGKWNVEIEISDGSGKVVKQYAVAGHDVDSIGDAVVAVDSTLTTVGTAVGTIDGKVDTIGSVLTTVDTAISALNDLSSSDVNAEIGSVLATYDAPTKAELDAAESTLVSNITAIDPGSGAMLG